MASRPVHCSSLTSLNSADEVESESTLKANISLPPDAYFTIDPRNLASKHCSRKSLVNKNLMHGVKQFNLDPKKGLESLSKGGFLNTESPKEVALFLFREGRLSKKQIGAFIGAHRDFNQSVLAEFVQLHEFTHLILVQALRQFLWSFR
jgi:Sec7-like guanine-nucleotide exchange factor